MELIIKRELLYSIKKREKKKKFLILIQKISKSCRNKELIAYFSNFKQLFFTRKYINIIQQRKKFCVSFKKIYFAFISYIFNCNKYNL